MNKYCVFSSVGDHSNLLNWFKNDLNPNWDLIVAFYGDRDDEFERISSHAVFSTKIKGSKFQNLKEVHKNNTNLFEKYEYILVCDDDINFEIGNISELFQKAAEYDFWVCQPAFDKSGRVSHKITACYGDEYSHRIVNFVEVTCPVFKAEKLSAFLEEYDGTLVGWGIDWWYSIFLNSRESGKFSVIDEIVVLNPRDEQRPGGMREITKLQSDVVRYNMWINTAKERGLSEFKHENLAIFKKSDVVLMNRIDEILSRVNSDILDRDTILILNNLKLDIFKLQLEASIIRVVFSM
jgi:hypothetical protein